MLTLAPYIEVSMSLSGAGCGTLVFGAPNTEVSLLLVPLAMGERGLPGFSVSVVAGEALGGHRAVTVTGFNAGPDDADLLAGVTLAAGVLGSTVDVQVQGLMTELSWNWTPGQPVFLGAAGVLTQSPLTTGPIRRIAWAVTATQINVDFMPPITQT